MLIVIDPVKGVLPPGARFAPEVGPMLSPVVESGEKAQFKLLEPGLDGFDTAPLTPDCRSRQGSGCWCRPATR